jgi:hypothetical protein
MRVGKLMICHIVAMADVMGGEWVVSRKLL